jgi:hypothetical protein
MEIARAAGDAVYSNRMYRYPVSKGCVYSSRSVALRGHCPKLASEQFLVLSPAWPSAAANKYHSPYAEQYMALLLTSSFLQLSP